MSWRFAALAREARLNLWASAGRSAVLVVIAAVAVGVLAFLELRQATDLRQFHHDYAAAGGWVALALGQESPIPAGRCEGLNTLPTVRTAGATLRVETTSSATAPGVLFQWGTITPGLVELWRPGARAAPAPPGGAVIVGTVLAQELGVEAGTLLAREGGSPVLVAAVVDVGRRAPQFQRWAIDFGPADGFARECWVEFDRHTYRAGSDSLAAWLSTGDKEPLIRPFTRPDEFVRDPAKEFADRPQRTGWLAAGGLIAAVFLLAGWFRRAELGLYLALGTPRLQLVAMLAVEAAFVVALATVVGLLWAFALQRWLDHPVPWDDVRLALRSGVSAALLGAALAPWAASLVVRGNIAALLKGR